MEPTPFDYSPTEQFQPIWLTDNCCVCLGDVSPPDSRTVCFRLSSPSYFGTGAHPFTHAIILALADMKLRGLNILDYKSGSGLLGIFCAQFEAEVTIHNQKEEAVIASVRNAIQNNVICHPARDTTLNKDYHGHFDLITCQHIAPHNARADIQLLEKMCAPYGTILISGWKAQSQRFVRGVLEEFFKVSCVGDLNGVPILQAEKNED